MLLRFVRLCAAAAGALALALLLNLALAQLSAAQPLPNAAMNASIDLPIATPTLELAETLEPADWFSATAVLTPSAAALAVRDAFTVTAQLVTTGTCGFAIYDVTLTQVEPLFTHVDPADNVIGPPGENPAIWRLAASRSGVTTFTVSFYGETYCDGVWSWTSVRSDSQEVTVAPLRVGLPFVSRNTPPISIRALGTLGGDESYANAINERGEVVGVSRLAAGQDRAFLWRDGVMTDLGLLGPGGSASSRAVAINERGQVVGGSSFGPPPSYRGFLWQDGVMTDLGSLDGRSSFAVDINERGQVIGRSSAITGGLFSFLWANGVMTDLGTLGGVNTEAVDLNDRGQVAGFTTTEHGIERAFLWRDGALINIHPSDEASYSIASAINERGQVAGSYSEAGRTLGFLWEEWVITPILGQGGASVYAIHDFNERGQVVGIYFSPSGLRAFLWERDAAGAGAVIDLGPVRSSALTSCPSLIDDNGWIVLQSPTGPVLWRDGRLTPLASLTPPSLYSFDCPQAMNNRGQIVGMSIAADGTRYAVLWDARESEGE